MMRRVWRHPILFRAAQETLLDGRPSQSVAKMFGKTQRIGDRHKPPTETLDGCPPSSQTTNSVLRTFCAGCTLSPRWSNARSVSSSGALSPCTRRGHFQGVAFETLIQSMFYFCWASIRLLRWDVNAGRSLMFVERM